MKLRCTTCNDLVVPTESNACPKCGKGLRGFETVRPPPRPPSSGTSAAADPELAGSPADPASTKLGSFEDALRQHGLFLSTTALTQLAVMGTLNATGPNLLSRLLRRPVRVHALGERVARIVAINKRIREWWFGDVIELLTKEHGPDWRPLHDSTDEKLEALIAAQQLLVSPISCMRSRYVAREDVETFTADLCKSMWRPEWEPGVRVHTPNPGKSLGGQLGVPFAPDLARLCLARAVGPGATASDGVAIETVEGLRLRAMTEFGLACAFGDERAKARTPLGFARDLQAELGAMAKAASG